MSNRTRSKKHQRRIVSSNKGRVEKLALALKDFSQYVHGYLQQLAEQLGAVQKILDAHIEVTGSEQAIRDAIEKLAAKLKEAEELKAKAAAGEQAASAEAATPVTLVAAEDVAPPPPVPYGLLPEPVDLRLMPPDGEPVELVTDDKTDPGVLELPAS